MRAVNIFKSVLDRAQIILTFFLKYFDDSWSVRNTAKYTSFCLSLFLSFFLILKFYFLSRTMFFLLPISHFYPDNLKLQEAFRIGRISWAKLHDKRQNACY